MSDMTYRILLAEDDDVNSLTIRRLLEHHGHSVDAVTNGYDALEKMRQNEYDVVLMDIRMPQLDGLEAMRRIRSDEEFQAQADIPIVALTAHAMMGDRETFLAEGMSGYLSKPVELADLLQVMQEVVKKSR
ncbi:CheY chemotaxis protein or a CheY-like REC (receiver) domain [Paucidesulfovibrio gracilis DSM 16080]|uniref:CheY chemotaxis protein or a CheY-like REC (Receiver) domain n=1 Tax=Paucidesulfovibrio gracilis DSM 16080 TaxID=1121449 RepID=A0A1T4XZG4_9BACT|nr:response regulator [Paucidesulfovibrio gracilis]SKA94608.1 CheY chemotaxis protein or a CheY-like REC (receiver) domain [Paucidesulfovibrio gracilis DSM 16080]